jgi:hypothetical protein
MEEEAYVTPAHGISYSDRLWMDSEFSNLGDTNLQRLQKDPTPL